jgi:hypothetical protein
VSDFDVLYEARTQSRLLRKAPTAEVIDTVSSVADEDCIVQLDV